MRYVAVVVLEEFYVAAATKQCPSLAAWPLVIFDTQKVADANVRARKRGVFPGMPLSQARALLSEGHFEELRRDRCESASREWLDLVVPFADVIEPIDQHIVAIDLSGHPRPGRILTTLLSRLRSRHPHIKVGVGQAKWTAMLAMEHDGDALSDPTVFLAGLSISALSPLSVRTREKLAQLGYTRVQQAQAIPYSVLARQFGSEALTIHETLHGRLSDPVRPLYPQQSMAGFRPFEGGTSDLEDVAAGCEALAAEVGERLAATESETTVLHLHIEHEDCVRTLSRTFAKPLRNASTIRRALLAMIDGEISDNVYALRVTLPDLVPSGRSQFSLFGGRAEDRARLEREVSRIRAAFGERAVVTGSQIVLPRRKLVLRELGGLVGWR